MSVVHFTIGPCSPDRFRADLARIPAISEAHARRMSASMRRHIQHAEAEARRVARETAPKWMERPDVRPRATSVCLDLALVGVP